MLIPTLSRSLRSYTLIHAFLNMHGSASSPAVVNLGAIHALTWGGYKEYGCCQALLLDGDTLYIIFFNIRSLENGIGRQSPFTSGGPPWDLVFRKNMCRGATNNVWCHLTAAYPSVIFQIIHFNSATGAVIHVETSKQKHLIEVTSRSCTTMFAQMYVLHKQGKLSNNVRSFNFFVPPFSD